MKSFIFGVSSKGLPIPAYNFGSSGPAVLILGGLHGNEPEGVVAAYALLKRFATSFSYRLNVDLVPIYNIDGSVSRTRKNGNGVDLNRNFPTSDWTASACKNANDDINFPGISPNSETESKALVQYIEEKSPSFILTLHSSEPLININGQCEKIAETMAKFTNYKIESNLSYPTSGCLGTYCGVERDIPTLAYEIEPGTSTEQILDLHLKALLEGLKTAEENIA